jgi:elongation factor P hydroxylase
MKEYRFVVLLKNHQGQREPHEFVFQAQTFAAARDLLSQQINPSRIPA